MGKWWGRAGSAFGVVVLLFLIALVAAPLALAMRNASGSHLWTWAYSGATSQAHMREVVAARNGSVFAIGATSSNGWDEADILAVKFTTGREPVWQRTWDSGVRGAYPWAATTDRASELVVGGMTATQSAGDDWVVLKYSPSGRLLWSTTLGGDYPSSDYLNDVVCDRAGNVYACGSLLDETDNHEFAVAKFRGSDGKLLWTQSEPGLNADWHDDQAMEMGVDAAGNVYATGISFDASRTDRRCLTMKLTPSGKVSWRRLVAAAGADRYGYHLSVVGSDVYVNVFSPREDDTAPIQLAKYTTGGRRSWLKTQTFKGVEFLYPNDLAAGPTGAVVVSASKAGSLIAKFSPRGALAWSHLYRSSDTRLSRSYSRVAMDGEGRVWAAGTALLPAVPNPLQDWLVQRFSPGGRSVWTKTWDGASEGYDELLAVTLAGASDLWVSGSVGNVDGGLLLPAVGKYRR